MEDAGPPPQSQEALQEFSQQLFNGRKERRRSSDAKEFLGDIHRVAEVAPVLRLLSKQNDTMVLFADIVYKINKRNKLQSRLFILTDKAVYNIDPSGYKIKRRIPLETVGGISVSHQSDNFFIIRVPSEYDYLLVSNRKVEIISRLVKAFEAAHDHKVTLMVEFNDSLEFKPDSDSYRELEFQRVQGGVNTVISAGRRKKK